MIHHRLTVLALLSTSSLAEGFSWSPSAVLSGKKSASKPQGSSVSFPPQGSSGSFPSQGSSGSFPPQGSSGSLSPTGKGHNLGSPQQLQTGLSQGGTDFGGGSNAIITAPQISWGPVYKVAIVRGGVNGECTERVMLGLDDTKWSKILSTKCKPGPGCFSCQPIRNEGNLLIIASPDEHMCVFTTNTKEIYYLLDGKWRKGGFDGDNSKDKELTAGEIDQIKGRVKKWQDYFEKSDKEKERIKGLIKEARDKYRRERDRIGKLKEKETDETVLKHYEKELSELEKKYQAEDNKLEALLTNQDTRVPQDVEENIKEGW